MPGNDNTPSVVLEHYVDERYVNNQYVGTKMGLRFKSENFRDLSQLKSDIREALNTKPKQPEPQTQTMPKENVGFFKKILDGIMGDKSHG